MSSSQPHFTEPTTHYWQSILPVPRPSSPSPPSPLSCTPPYKHCYPATLPDSRILMLPIRPLHSNPAHAVASLLVNHASLAVVKDLVAFLADEVGRRWPDVEALVGVPTLGLCVVSGVAERLALTRYVPLGYSRKFWYDEKLSAEVSSITSPGVGMKRVYLDPNLLPLIKGKRVVVIDDAISSGRTLKVVWDLLEEVGAVVEGVGVVMRQGSEWEKILGEERARRVIGVFESPLLKAVEGGWVLR